MSEGSRGGNGGLYFIVGGLVVVVGLGAFLYSGGNLGFLGMDKTTVHQTTTSAVPAPAGNVTTTTTTEKTKH